MLEKGYVKSIKGNYATVVFKRKSGCGDNCAHCSSSCSVENSVVEVKNALDASVGDEVEVSLETKSLVKMTLWVYGLPLLMAILGIILGNFIFGKMNLKNIELFSSLLGVLFLGVSFSCLGKIDKNLSKNKKYTLTMVRILGKCKKPLL